MNKSAEGVPYPRAEAGPVDDWSERIYRALENWPVARKGEWTRWEPGYVLLTIRRSDDQEIDPIYLHTSDQELTVTFGFWETHNPAPYGLWNAEPEVVAGHAKALVERWLHGAVRTAVLTDDKGEWCGTSTIEPGELEPQLREAARWLRDNSFRPATIEVRTPLVRDWQTFDVKPEWLLPSG
jgi:hypothetical protein